jgi:coenzyme F420-reducing hydrogenase beta subunit
MDALERTLWSGCIYCEDLTARFSDVSFGWSTSPEWNAVIVRTEQGKELIDSAKENGLIEIRKMSEEGIDRLTEEEEEKIRLGSKRPFLTENQLVDFRPKTTRKR